MQRGDNAGSNEPTRTRVNMFGHVCNSTAASIWHNEKSPANETAAAAGATATSSTFVSGRRKIMEKAQNGQCGDWPADRFRLGGFVLGARIMLCSSVGEVVCHSLTAVGQCGILERAAATSERIQRMT